MPAAWIAGATLVTGLIGADASRSAANTQADAARESSQAQQQMFDRTTANVAPWLDAGKTSLSKLMSGVNDGSLMPQAYRPFTMADFQTDPGYQFELQQGLNALTNKMSVSGGPNSNNLKGLIGYSQGLASQDYQTALNNYMAQFQLGNQVRQQGYNNLAGISATGLGAGLHQGQIGAQVGQNIGSNIIGAGNARAAGTIGTANAITGAMGQGYNAWLQQQYMNNGGGGYTYSQPDPSLMGPPTSAMTPSPSPSFDPYLTA